MLEQLAAVHWLRVFLFAAWILPVPTFVSSNIEALGQLGLRPVQIKIAATVCGLCWPYFLIRGLLK